MEALRSRCAAFGFQAGTTMFAQCMQREDQAGRARRAALDAQEAAQAAQKRAADQRYWCVMGGGTNCDGRKPSSTTTCQRDVHGVVTCATR